MRAKLLFFCSSSISPENLNKFGPIVCVCVECSENVHILCCMTCVDDVGVVHNVFASQQKKRIL